MRYTVIRYQLEYEEGIFPTFAMQSLATVVDSSQRYIANIISKNGRNEIQIYPVEQVGQAGDELATANLAVRIELEAEEHIERVRWVQDIDSFAGKKKASRKRNADDREVEEDTEGSIYLFAILENSNIICISPNSNQILTTIENGDESHKILDLESCNTSTVWTIGENGKLREVVVSTGKIKKEVQLTNVDNNVSQIASIKKSARQNMFLLGSSSLYLVDPSKKKPVVDIESSQNATITQIVESIVRPDHVYVTREGANTIEIYQITPTSIASINSITIEGDAITAIRLSASHDDGRELLLVLTTEGVEVFSLNKESGALEALNIITTNVRTSPLVTFVPQKNTPSYVGLWYDGNEPRFTKFETDFTKDIELEILQKNGNDVDMNSKDETVLVPEYAKIHNLDAGKLLAQLQDLLAQNLSEQVDAEVIGLCETNDDEDRIKEIIKTLGSSLETSAFATKLFAVISKAVAADPASGSSLSVWLKWILLANGGHIAKQPEQYENVKNLQQGLSDGMKMVPRLLALQGRLQLLKAQADLRSRIGTEDNEDFSVLNDDDNGKEDTLLYANGEDDDDEYAEESDIGVDGKRADISDIED